MVASRIRASGSARRIASTVVTPATPEPTTTTSVSLRQPGGGASSVSGDHAAAADLQADVVDQPGRPDAGGDQQHGGTAVARPDLGEGVRIGEHEVVELPPADSPAAAASSTALAAATHGGRALSGDGAPQRPSARDRASAEARSAADR